MFCRGRVGAVNLFVGAVVEVVEAVGIVEKNNFYFLTVPTASTASTTAPTTKFTAPTRPLQNFNKNHIFAYWSQS